MTIIWKHLVASTLRRARVALAPIQSMNDRRRSLLVAGALVLAGLTLPGASTCTTSLASDARSKEESLCTMTTRASSGSQSRSSVRVA